MNAERHQQVKVIFNAARDLPRADRDVFLEKACAGDVELLKEVRSLIEYDKLPTEEVFGQNADPSSDGQARAEDDLLHGTIGEYSIERVIASGGMGTVYEARQESPRRKVALKAMRRGLRSPSTLRRFKCEAEILARMRHPAIAQVYGASTFAEGDENVPYFVMEYIDGAMSITEYARRHRLGLVERLRLFARVCDAVHHAHQRGVIHRDLKPNNILVDPTGSPKIIDFGVARITPALETSKVDMPTAHTSANEVLGTLPYMSPEQTVASTLDTDTRTDVYSLGVVLYELLTNLPPFELPREATILQLQRMVVEVDPPRPSVRVQSAAHSKVETSSARPLSERSTPQNTQTSVLRSRLRGDLDWIVMKCLEKSPERRYGTAEQLATDVRRHLAHEPVLASPPSATYRMRKFVQRHRLGVAVASLIAVLMTAATVVSWRFSLVATEQRYEAEAQARALERVTEFQEAQLRGISRVRMGEHLRESILAKRQSFLEASGVSEYEIYREMSALEGALDAVNFTTVALDALDAVIFDRTLRTIASRLDDDPLIKARLLQSTARTMRDIGLLERAMAPQQESLEIRRLYLGDDHPDTLESMNNMGGLLDYLGKHHEAEALFLIALQGYRQLYGEDHRETLTLMNNLGLAIARQGRLDEAEPFYRKAIAGRRRVLGSDHTHTLTSVHNLGLLLMQEGRLAEAEPYMREVMETSRRVQGNDHRLTMFSLNNMGFLLSRQGRLAEAELYRREAMETRRRVLGDRHQDTLTSISSMGSLLRDLGSLEEAEKLGAEAVEGASQVLGERHRHTGMYLLSYGRTLAELERFADAEPAMLQAHSILTDALGSRNDRIIGAIRELADLYDAWHAAAPGKGYDEKAAEWRAKLPVEDGSVTDGDGESGD